MRTAGITLLTAFLTAFGGIQTAGAQGVSADTIAAAIGLGAAEQARLRAGEIVSVEIEETDEKQLAVALALMVPATLEDVAASVREGTTIEANAAIKAHGQIDPAQVGEASFAGITLDAGEVRRLLEVEPGSELNLSSEEIAVFEALGQQYKAGDPGCRGRRQRRLAAGAGGSRPGVPGLRPRRHRALRSRRRRYVERGRRPQDRGRSARRSCSRRRQSCTRRSWTFRATASPMRSNQFFWTQQVADDRPVYVLTHRMTQQRPDMVVLLSRDFYVSHSFNASQASAGALPVEEGVVIFYGNRTSSDQVAGFMSGMRHEIGRGMMRDSLVEAMEEIRTAWR